MIVFYFTPAPAALQNAVAGSFSRLAWPLDCRTPEPLLKLLEKLDQR